MTITEFQQQIERLYFDRDQARGVELTFRWFIEEVGELAKAMRRDDAEQLREEFSDVTAWLFTLASLLHVDMAEAAERYAHDCPKCAATPCQCGPE